MNEVMNINTDVMSLEGVTALGLDESKNYSDEELDQLASGCRAVGTALDWLLGDLYIKKCAKLGIVERQEPAPGARSSIENWCLQHGIDRHTAENKASICRDYPRSERVQGLSLTHHQFAQSMEGEARRQLLLDAQKGDPEFEQIWSTRRLKEERKIREGKAATPASRLVTPPKEKEKEEDLLREALLNKNIPKQVVNTTVSTVKKHTDKLDKEYDNRVTEEANKLVDFKLEKEKQRLSELSDKLAKKEKLLKMRSKQVHGMMSRLEYKKIIGCLHPDRQPENRRKAFEEATQIFLRLKDTVQPDAAWKD